MVERVPLHRRARARRRLQRIHIPRAEMSEKSASRNEQHRHHTDSVDTARTQSRPSAHQQSPQRSDAKQKRSADAAQQHPDHGSGSRVGAKEIRTARERHTGNDAAPRVIPRERERGARTVARASAHTRNLRHRGSVCHWLKRRLSTRVRCQILVRRCAKAHNDALQRSKLHAHKDATLAASRILRDGLTRQRLNSKNPKSAKCNNCFFLFCFFCFGKMIVDNKTRITIN